MEEFLSRLACREFGGHDYVPFAVKGLVLLRNVDISAGDGVQLSVRPLIHGGELDAVIRLSVGSRLVNIQPFVGLDGQGIIGILRDLAGFEGEPAVADVVAVFVHRHSAVFVQDISVAVVADICDRREIRVVAEFLLNGFLRLQIQSGVDLQTAFIYFVPRLVIAEVLLVLQIRDDLLHHVVGEVGDA